MNHYRIGETAEILRMSVDTLRYYERIGLMPSVARTASGIRRYTDDDVARLRFIQRAQLMNFSLAEIGELLEFRKNPRRSKKKVRELATDKLGEIDARLAGLKKLRAELGGLVEACPGTADNCAIISGIEGKSSRRAVPGRRGEFSRQH
jgi:DNA-binding transcriptional MerR regulator